MALRGGYGGRIVPALLDALLPPRCALCGLACAGPDFCLGCRFDLPRIRAACAACGEPLAGPLPAGVVCGRCQRRPPPFECATAPLRYAFPVDEALKALKFRRQLFYARAFARVLYGEFLRHHEDADALAPVPLHPLRHARRGFNQSVLLCAPLARLTGLPVLANLRRVRRTAPQAGLAADSRRRNLAGAFRVRGELGCRRPLIVDDVMTTGETCRHLAAALRAAGAESVRVLTVARASS